MIARIVLAAALAWIAMGGAGGTAWAQQDLRLRGDLCFPMRAGQTLRSVAVIGNPRDPRARDWQRTLGDQLRVAPGGAEVTLAGWTWPGNAVALAILRSERRGVRVLGVWEDCFGPEGCEMQVTDRQAGPPTMIVLESRCSVPVDDPRAPPRTASRAASAPRGSLAPTSAATSWRSVFAPTASGSPARSTSSNTPRPAFVSPIAAALWSSA